MTRNHRAIVTATLVFLLFIGVGGCWSAEELNNRAFVNTVLIDLTEDGQTELTVGVPLPNRMIPGQAGGTGQPQGDPFSFVTKRADNLSQALNLIQVDLPRDISFGQTRIIVVGRRQAEQGLDKVVEFVFRQPSFRLSASLFITPRNVKEITRSPMVFERILSDILRKYVNNHYTLDTTVKDYKLALYQGGDILIPLLNFGELPGVAMEDPKKNRWMGSGGAAIFSGGKMAKIELSPTEHRTALWISSQLKNTTITIASPSDEKEMSFFIEGIKTSIDPVVRGDQLSFRIKSSAKAFVETSLSYIDLKDPEVLQQLEEILNKKVEEEFIGVLDKTRQARSDAFIMSQYLDWRYPKIWHSMRDQWKNFYAKELPIEVDVEIQLNRTGGVYRSVVHETNR
ncbi:MAG: Ger(x)C family spore germination protein [Paenibacillaceae bacterium]|uniref:Ger(X)C family spore germination protein n=1 Tax=Paenibacillus mellifer TaxID=2937794 RepID=A0A9X1XWN9_9BACL|nr:Ger(x)C family spore germination protein [Paenibacillus mellifer]MBW4838116.1 Ger(x)C family spore germination protein [Paenibacillaceae bacterium]MCK8486960.1 Ger(x)C family spore germination protein [Paenibacillus mellifer]